VLRVSYRLAATVGAVILTVGSALLILLYPGASPLQPILAAGLMGLGMGIANISFVVAIQANLDWSQRGAGMSSLFFSRLVGQSLGSAVFGGIFNAGLASRSSLNGGDVVQLLQQGRGQITGIAGIQSVLDALAHSIHNIYLLSGLLALLVLAGVLMLPSNLKLVEG
jgi:hypothetical protein